MSIVNHARTLPVEFAKSVTSKNMSFAVFMYGAVSEIHSSMSGLEPPMDQETLEAKLQHIMNVIHVTCLNATASDFKPVAWLVGRTYHNLVQSKVDLGRECWADFNTLYRGNPHAAEMVAAEREHRAAFMKQPKQEKPERGAERNSDKIKKPLCSSWNNFETDAMIMSQPVKSSQQLASMAWLEYQSQTVLSSCQPLGELNYCVYFSISCPAGGEEP